MEDKNIINKDGEINFKVIFNIFYKKKLFIAFYTLIVSVLAITYSLTLPNIYTSSTLLASSSSDSLSSRLSSYSALAGIAGINMPAEDINKSDEAIKRLLSFDFFSKYIAPNIKSQDLLAAKKWIPEKNKIIYNSKFFYRDEWVRSVRYPQKTIPSDRELYKEYLKIIEITKDKKNSFVLISIEHISPYIAKEWLDLILYYINESMRNDDKIQAENSIKFLNEEFTATNSLSLRDAISSLMETQIQTLMMTSSTNDYTFEVIDSSFVPEEKSGPFRSIICIISFIIGLISSLILVLFFENRNKQPIK
jgi:LPS O-antigen subunit length determinant protein (WzzB/FepE family)